MEGLQPGTISNQGRKLTVTCFTWRASRSARTKTSESTFDAQAPQEGDVEIAGNEIKIKKQIHFETDSAKIVGDSTSLLEEIATR